MAEKSIHKRSLVQLS